jgi:hypothetical protein
MTRRALLEDSKLPSPVILLDTLYLELTIGQMSAQELTLFEFPCIGDDLNVRDHSNKLRYMLDRLRAVVDRCSNPPHFRGVKNPITELLEPEPLKPNPRMPETKRMTKIPRDDSILARAKILIRQRTRQTLPSAPLMNTPAPFPRA